MDAEWIQVRLRRATMELLKKWEARAMATGREPGLNVGMLNGRNIGHDVAIRILLERDAKGKARSDKHHKKQKDGLDNVCSDR